MSILDEVFKSIAKSTLDEQVKIICDQIMTEERPKFLNPQYEPVGPNIFLAVEFSDAKTINYLCLERESKEKYIVVVWSKSSSLKNVHDSIKRKKVYELNDPKISSAEKIIEFYAKTLKYVRGE